MTRTLLASLSLLAAAAFAGCASGNAAAPSSSGAPTPGQAGPGMTCDASKANAGARVIRRLTNFEYDATLGDFVGIAPKYGATFPPDDVVNGFDDNAAALHVAPLYTDKARAAAEDVAASVALDALVPCPVASGDATCATKFIAAFGLRAFRRPLTSGESARYAALYGAVATTEAFEGGVRAVLAAMLQSPSFLYRAELGEQDATGYALTPYEVAQELSYLLTGSMPDAALFADAASGALLDRSVIASHAKRLLASDKGRALLEHFVRQWLALDQLSQAVKDPTAYPMYTPALGAAMYDETVAVFVKTMQDGSATLPDLLTAKATWASDALAKFYGLGAPTGPADARGLRPYALPAGRSGLLTHASILATQAKPDRPSPVHRGKLVRERFFCQALPPPPQGVDLNLPAVSPTASNRERFSEHSSNPACAGCHKRMDPIGFGFEGFDGIGAPVPGSVDTSGAIYDTDHTDGTFDGVPDLAARLAASPDVQACFALEWFRFGYGVDETEDTSCGAPAILQGFTANKLNLQALVLSLTQADHFLRRVPDDGASSGPVATTDAGTADVGASDATTPPPAPDASPTGGVTVSVHTDSSWASGYCATATVTNPGTTSVTWTATLPASGTLTQTWNASETTVGASWVFTGVAFNASVAGGGSAQFGFCVSH